MAHCFPKLEAAISNVHVQCDEDRCARIWGSFTVYVDSCPNQPMHGMAFCVDHCHIAEGEGIPCALREGVPAPLWSEEDW